MASSPRSSPSATPRSTSCFRSRAILTTSRARAACAFLSMLTKAGGFSRRLRLRDRPFRLPLDLSCRAAHHSLGDRVRRRSRHAMAHRRRRRALPFSDLRPSDARRARTRSRKPHRTRRSRASAFHFARTPIGCGASAIPRPSTISSAARPTPSRRSAAMSCFTPTACFAAAPMP